MAEPGLPVQASGSDGNYTALGVCEDFWREAVSYIEYAVSQAKTGRYGQVCYCDQEMLEKCGRRKKIIRILKDSFQSQRGDVLPAHYSPGVEQGEFLEEIKSPWMRMKLIPP